MSTMATATQGWLDNECPSHEEGVQTIDNICYRLAGPLSQAQRDDLIKAIELIKNHFDIDTEIQIPKSIAA